MKASEVPDGAQLRQRHRNNPRGAWQPLASLADRLPQRVVEVWAYAGVEGWVWEAVEFPHGGARVAQGEDRRGGKREGAGRKPAQNQEKKEKRKKDSNKR